MMTRDEQVRRIAQSIKIESHLIGLRRLAAETSAAYADLVTHGTPAKVAEHYFACSRLRERLDEERKPSRDTTGR
ncbi:hypothetical protein Q2941_32520 [Bradyrhizobium sp. UFLA05-153]